MPLLSHYGDVPDISYRLTYPSLVFSIITPLFIIARFSSRYFFTKHLGADDWMILVSLVLAETVSIQMLIVCGWAFGKHQDDVPAPILAKTLKLYFFAQVFYKIDLGTTKISILLLYIKVFVRRWFNITCWACICIVVAFTIGTVFSSIFQCAPVQYAFDKHIEGGGTCIDMTAFWYGNAAFNILSDVVIIALPIPVISKLQLPLRTKIAVCGIFAVGFFVCVTSVLRISSLDVATSHLDTPWNSINSSVWTVIEMNLGIICACLPTFRQLLTALFPRIFSGLRKTVDGIDGTSVNGSRVRTRNKGELSGFSGYDKNDAGWTKMSTRPSDKKQPDEVLRDDYEGSSRIRMTTSITVHPVYLEEP